MKTLVLKIPFGGLGDHLFLSPLPRIAKSTGAYQRVLISEQSDFRHVAYRTLLWETNPYIDGFTADDAPAPVLGRVPSGGNLVDAIMLAYGLDDGVRFHEPELHYRPAIRQELASSIVYDPNFVSYVGDVSGEDVQRYFESVSIRPDYMLSVREKNCGVTNYGQLLTTKDFEDYCSVIVSSKSFICLTSGGATLAAALKKPSVALWGQGQNPIFHHSKLHKYVNVHPNIGQRSFPAFYGAAERSYFTAKAAFARMLNRRKVHAQLGIEP